MITNRGKLFFKNFLASQTGQMVGAASFGIGSTAAAATDERLQFEFARQAVDVVAYDSVNNRLVFKGTIPQEVGGTIYEVGLWTSEANVMAVSDQPRIITTFDSETEEWTNETTSLTARIGVDSLRHTPPASTSAGSTLAGLTLDFNDNPSTDSFILAYNVGNSNTAAIRVRFYTNSTNYYDMNISNPTAGYKFSSVTKGSLTATGSPDWADITSIDVTTVSNSGGASDVLFDGLRIEDNDTTNLDYGLVARFIPAVPVVKPVGQVLDFEYTLAVTV